MADCNFSKSTSPSAKSWSIETLELELFDFLPEWKVWYKDTVIQIFKTL